MPNLSSTSSSTLNKTHSSSTLNKSSSFLPCDTAPFALDFNPYTNVRPATGFRYILTL